MQYFPISVLLDALENLKPIDSKWLIIPLVLAANDVNSARSITCTTPKAGANPFIKAFFGGQQIGLEPKQHGGACNIRPGNIDPRRASEKLVSVDYGKLWGNIYSQSGYNDWQDGSILARKSAAAPGQFQLGPNFATTFRTKIATSFKFESLLIWLFAFRGFPDSVTSWAQLLAHFEAIHTDSGIPTEYGTVFSLSPTEPWPTGLLTTRPTDEEFQLAIVPELASTAINPADLIALRDELQGLIQQQYLGLLADEPRKMADSVVSALQSSRRLFLFGEPGTGKTELARLTSTAFSTVFGRDRVHAVFVPIADSTTSDKLVGFSTLDGSWVDGALTQASGNPSKSLLYAENAPVQSRRQINVLILDEANRRDIEELLVKFQAALDSESADSNYDDFCVSLDNSGEKWLSPNTFLVMTGNSPREDSGRVVQSRPFKRRHNLLTVPNVFCRVLIKPNTDFAADMKHLWSLIGTALRIEDSVRVSFAANLVDPAHAVSVGSFQTVLSSIEKHNVGVSFGLVKKILKTAGLRFGLTNDFSVSLDYGLTESVVPLLSAEESVGGRSLKATLEEIPLPCKTSLPWFFESTESLLRGPDALGRIRPFL